MLDELKSQKRIVGLKQSLKAVSSGDAIMAFIAQDADDGIKNQIEARCVQHSIPFEYVESKSVLGNACGIEVSAAVAVIVK